MTGEFLTQGLRSDRYLKAVRLADQFETEIEAMLCNVGERMIVEQPDLFEPDVEPDTRIRGETKSMLAYARVHYPLNRVPSSDSSQTMKLNVHLYWRDPATCNRPDVDGALRAFGYKIKDAAVDDDRRVAEETHEWPLETAENPYDSNTVFYSHVSSVDEMEQTAETLVKHFGKFGQEFGIPVDE